MEPAAIEPYKSWFRSDPHKPVFVRHKAFYGIRQAIFTIKMLHIIAGKLRPTNKNVQGKKVEGV